MERGGSEGNSLARYSKTRARLSVYWETASMTSGPRCGGDLIMSVSCCATFLDALARRCLRAQEAPEGKVAPEWE